MCNLERWTALCSRAGAVAHIEESYHTLVARYAEPPRAYHNFTHVAKCLAAYDLLAAKVERPEAVELAIWFHDAIYDTHRTDNEQRSADVAMRTLTTMGIPMALYQFVAELILLTRHDQDPTTPDGRVIIDVDLAILGAPRKEYDAYEAQIREEYAWVDDTLFRSKRREFLIAMLQRPHIFHTPLYRARYEASARENLQRAIAALGDGC